MVYIGEKLNLKTNSFYTSRIVTNKYRMRGNLKIKFLSQNTKKNTSMIFQFNQGIIRNERMIKSVEEDEGEGFVFDKYKEIRKNQQ